MTLGHFPNGVLITRSNLMGKNPIFKTDYQEFWAEIPI